MLIRLSSYYQLFMLTELWTPYKCLTHFDKNQKMGAGGEKMQPKTRLKITPSTTTIQALEKSKLKKVKSEIAKS